MPIVRTPDANSQTPDAKYHRTPDAKCTPEGGIWHLGSRGIGFWGLQHTKASCGRLIRTYLASGVRGEGRSCSLLGPLLPLETGRDPRCQMQLRTPLRRPQMPNATDQRAVS
jgi:hypothetical protein